MSALPPPCFCFRSAAPQRPGLPAAQYHADAADPRQPGLLRHRYGTPAPPALHKRCSGAILNAPPRCRDLFNQWRVGALISNSPPAARPRRRCCRWALAADEPQDSFGCRRHSTPAIRCGLIDSAAGLAVSLTRAAGQQMIDIGIAEFARRTAPGGGLAFADQPAVPAHRT